MDSFQYTCVHVYFVRDILVINVNKPGVWLMMRMSLTLRSHEATDKYYSVQDEGPPVDTGFMSVSFIIPGDLIVWIANL